MLLCLYTIKARLNPVCPINVAEGDTTNLEEINRMREENARLKEENDILKKAMAIFAKK